MTERTRNTLWDPVLTTIVTAVASWSIGWVMALAWGRICG